MTHPRALTLGQQAAFPAAHAGGVRTRHHELGAPLPGSPMASRMPPFQPLFSIRQGLFQPSSHRPPQFLAPAIFLTTKQTPIKNWHWPAV